MSEKRLKFLWLDFPIPPEKWVPKRGELGDGGYHRLSPSEKRMADNFSICDQRNTFLEDAYLNIARSIVFITRIWAVTMVLFILTFGPQLIDTIRDFYGVRDSTKTAATSK